MFIPIPKNKSLQTELSEIYFVPEVFVTLHLRALTIECEGPIDFVPKRTVYVASRNHLLLQNSARWYLAVTKD